MMLARAGWYWGDPGAVMRAPADEVVAAAQYETFINDYEATVIEINREGK
jgi:hypothetical protein